MKILQVIQYFSQLGGGSIDVVYNLSKQLADQGNEVTILTSDYMSKTKYSLKNTEIKMFHTKINLSGFYYTPDMKKFLNKDFDIIHLHNFRTYQNIIVSEYARKHSIPYIIQAHGSLLRILHKFYLKYFFDLFYGYKIIKNAKRFVAVSQKEIKQYTSFNIPNNKIELIPNGLDINIFKNLPKKGEFIEKYSIGDKKIISYIGRINRRKGIDFLIKAFYLVNKEVPNSILIIAGLDDGFLKECLNLVKKLNLSKQVIFLGFLTQKDKLSLMIDSNLLVYPAFFEIFGLIPLEAIMCNTPVIVSSDCGCGEVIQSLGLNSVVEYGSINSLKKIIIDILNNYDKYKKQVFLARNKIQEKFNWKKIAYRYKKMYEMMV
jgi:glycosyltransferase involved in cell wall biosynthesis